MTARASILIVGHPRPEQVEFGADHCTTYDSAIEILEKNKYAVVVVADRLPHPPKPQLTESLGFFKKSRAINEDMQFILISTDASPQELQMAINAFGLFKIMPNFENNALQLTVREALEEYELIKQNQAFLILTQEQNQRLQHLSVLLEDRVNARQKFLVEAREKLQTATRKTEALNRALVAIQKSVTKQEIEHHLNEALHTALGLTWTRILFREQSYLDQLTDNYSQNSTAVFSAPLFRDLELLGHIYFGRDHAKPFTNDEDDFLLQISDAVGLAMDRLMALDALEELKQEWDSTFDSITEPVSLVDAQYNIVRANLAYSKKAGLALNQLIGKKCHQVLFQKNSPCVGCRLGATFELDEKKYAVSSHLVNLDKKDAYAMLYRDVSQEQRIQRQILESSKMAEIGTIGSSIAHEINNPLGGMLAFLQILKSEIKPGDKIYDDVVEMEKAATRCKTIVENLLAFTRQSVSSEMQIVRTSELFKLVNNIMNLQTRSLGIVIETQMEEPDAKVKSDTNQLVQVLVNVIQNSCESIAERLSMGKRSPPGKIWLKSYWADDNRAELKIEITDNGTGIRPSDLAQVFTPFFTTKEKTKNPGLGLSVSYQIVKEHGGQMEIYSSSEQSATVIVTLPVAKSPTV